MLEAVYCGEEEIEDRYLHNFSEKEKNCLRRHIQKVRKIVSEHQIQWNMMVAIDSPIHYGQGVTLPSHVLELKYILNKIAANDPKNTTFELRKGNRVKAPDRLALDIAKAFKNNTHCQRVVLQGMGLTDEGLLPLLSTFRKKKLLFFDLSGNNLTDMSYQAIDRVLSDSETQWDYVRLGNVTTTLETVKALRAHENLSFISIPPKTRRIQGRFDRLDHCS